MHVISAIVPVYNVEKFLNECIDSILNQTYTYFELILVDDGSTDQSGHICDQYAEKDGRIRVVHQSNQGLSAARNKALDLVTGEYITFIDSDDIVSEYYFEELLLLILKYDADISVCDIISFKDGKCFENRGEPDAYNVVCMDNKEAVLSIYSNNKRHISVSAYGKLYRKFLFDNQRFPVGRIHEDQYIIPIVFHEAGNVVWLERALYWYREREGSITHQNFSLKRYDDIKAVDHCIIYFNLCGETDLAIAAKKRKEELLAYYSLLARKNHIYFSLPKEYWMSRFTAIKTMRRHLPIEKYSYYLIDFFPGIIHAEAYLRRFLQRIGIDCRSM